MPIAISRRDASSEDDNDLEKAIRPVETGYKAHSHRIVADDKTMGMLVVAALTTRTAGPLHTMTET